MIRNTPPPLGRLSRNLRLATLRGDHFPGSSGWWCRRLDRRGFRGFVLRWCLLRIRFVRKNLILQRRQLLARDQIHVLDWSTRGDERGRIGSVADVQYDRQQSEEVGSERNPQGWPDEALRKGAAARPWNDRPGRAIELQVDGVVQVGIVWRGGEAGRGHSTLLLDH